MNIKEIILDEIDLHSYFVEEGISAILHTILFVRAPNLVKPEDHFCTKLAPLTFAKCGPSEVDQTVVESLSLLEKSRSPAGPQCSRGVVSVSFLERRESKALFGLLRSEEKVCFERWRVPVLIRDADLPAQSPRESQRESQGERERLFSFTRSQVQQRILFILESANRFVEHLPPALYEFEIEATGAGGERREASLVARLINSPMI